MGTNSKVLIFTSLILLVGLSGCREQSEPLAAGAVQPSTTPTTAFSPDVPAGVPVGQMAGAEGTIGLAHAMQFITRNDPFALLRQEQAFEASQRAERLVQEMGGFITVWEPPPPPPDDLDVPVEPQPYRRLAGILVGDAVLAIIELEGGRTEIIRPGMMIPNSEWRVISIDSEKAVLRRAGNRRPNQIVVRLESRPAGVGGQPGGAPGAGGGPPGRGPTAPSPGAPGQPTAPEIGG